MSILLSIVRVIGLGGVAALLILAFYEGVPYASRIPFLREIPFVAGYRYTYAADQVKIATENMVSKYELLSKNYQLEQERKYREAAERAAEVARKEKLASDLIAARRQEALQAAIEAAKDFQRPTEDELKWLEQQAR